MATIIALADSHSTTLARLSPRLREALATTDFIVHAGDHTESGLLQELKAHGDVIAVAGNMDSIGLKSTLSTRQLVTVAGKSVGVAHGSGAPQSIQERVRRLFPEDPELIIFGHSHVPYKGIVDGSLMVNPGPAASSYAVITVSDIVSAEIVKL